MARSKKPLPDDAITAELRKIETANRRMYAVGRLYLEGVLLDEIADRLGIYLDDVKSDLQVLRHKWQEKNELEYNHKLSEELARLDKLEQTYWEAWEQSKQGTVKTKVTEVRQVVNKGTKEKPIWVARHVPSEKQHEVTTSAGNPKFLSQVQEIVQLRLKMIGALKEDAHQQNTTISVDWSGLAIGSTGVPGGEVIDQLPGPMDNLDDDPIEREINAIAPVPKPEITDIPLVTRRTRGDEIQTGLKELPKEGTNGR